MVPSTPRTFLLVAAAHRLQNNPMQSPEGRINCVGLALVEHDNVSMSDFFCIYGCGFLAISKSKQLLSGRMNAVKHSEAPSNQNKLVTGKVAASATTAQQCKARAS